MHTVTKFSSVWAHNGWRKWRQTWCLPWWIIRLTNVFWYQTETNSSLEWQKHTYNKSHWLYIIKCQRVHTWFVVTCKHTIFLCKIFYIQIILVLEQQPLYCKIGALVVIKSQNQQQIQWSIVVKTKSLIQVQGISMTLRELNWRLLKGMQTHSFDKSHVTMIVFYNILLLEKGKFFSGLDWGQINKCVYSPGAASIWCNQGYTVNQPMYLLPLNS